VLRGEQRVEMRRATGRKVRARKAALAADVDSELFARLKAWRTAQARSQSVPPYVVFHDATLAAIAAAQPRDLRALAGIPGIGEKKLERYGPALLEVLRP
jgi:ATP-dependent DNA helicase RecQ